jgi:hypothetical protein
VEEFRAASSAIPLGSAVLSVWTGWDQAPGAVVGAAAYSHLASYAIIDRKAFDPLEFTGRGMQPLSVTKPYEQITPQATRPLLAETARTLEYWRGPQNSKMMKEKVGYAVSWPTRFDRVIYYHFGDTRNFDSRKLRMVASGSFFSILQPVADPANSVGSH